MSSYVCPKCGLDYDTILPADGVAALRSYPRRYGEYFPDRDDDEKPDGVIHRRPEPTVWSMLEYLGHVTDSITVLADAVRRMTTEDHPTLGFFDPDKRAEEERYNERAKDDAMQRFTAAASQAADVIANVDRNAWSKTAEFPWGERDALVTMRNLVHEGYHHLRDIEDVLKRVVGRPT